MNAAPRLIALLLIALVAATPACADGAVDVHAFSSQAPEGEASTGSSITVTSSTPGRSGRSGSGGGSVQTANGEGGSAGAPASGSPGRVEPLGQGSYRYTGAGGEECLYLTEGVNSCAGEEEARPVAPAQPARPAVSPEAVAVTVSDRLNLEVGRIVASPSAQTAGLTGAASWFWLEPAPAARVLSISLRGEQVTVSASVKEVLWSFGDGAQLAGGAGVSYRPGTAPAGAVLHTYNTRCLPGDRGRDPNVLASCGAEGYTVAANVVWAISYQASGPVSASGTLPSRTTAGSIAYPVSEARAFLTSASGGGG
jgi:hypothetical protein